MCIFEFGEVYGCWTYGTAKHPSLDPKQHVREEAATARAQVAQKLLKQFGSDRYQVWSIVATTLQVRLPPPERERAREREIVATTLQVRLPSAAISTRP